MNCIPYVCRFFRFKQHQTKFLFLLFIIVFLFSCGKDGKEGEVFIRIINGSSVCPITSYTDNNPSIPDQFYLNTYYKCNKGSYSYAFIACQEYWRGSYTITAEAGEDGGFLSDGNNGKTKKYTLQCWGYSEPDFTYTLSKTVDGWKKYPDIIMRNEDGTTLRISREVRPIRNVSEKVDLNKLANP